jgi:tRNA dimethylallyltransferase
VVFFQTGRRMSEQKTDRPHPAESSRRIRIFALNPPRPELYRRIEERADSHFAGGLVKEVQELLDGGVSSASNALGAHGYRRVVEYLQGKRDLESAIRQTKLDIRHYAKRQLTWFRHEPDVEWFDGFGEDEQLQKAIKRAIKARS